MFPKSSRVRFSRRLSTLRGVVLFPAAPTLPTISNRTGKRNMVSNVRSPQSDTVPPRQAFYITLPRSPCRRSDVPQASTHKHFVALAPNRASLPSRRTPRTRHFALASPQPPTRRARARLSASLSPE